MARSDPYGYDLYANRAFVAGAEWAVEADDATVEAVARAVWPFSQYRGEDLNDVRKVLAALRAHKIGPENKEKA